MRHPFLVLSAVLVLTPGAALAGPAITPGLWEITTTTAISGVPGMPQGMKGLTNTLRQCITQKDADDPGAISRQSQGQCRELQREVRGSRFRSVMDCGENGKVRTEMTMKGDTFEGTSILEPATKGRPGATTTLKGRRVGACPAK